MVTEIVKAVGVLQLELLACQWFLLQIDEDSAIYILDVIFV